MNAAGVQGDVGKYRACLTAVEHQCYTNFHSLIGRNNSVFHNAMDNAEVKKSIWYKTQSGSCTIGSEVVAQMGVMVDALTTVILTIKD